MMHAADLVVTLSGPMRDEIVYRHGVPADRVRVVPNAVDLSRFTPIDRDLLLREKLGLTGSFTLGYVSNLRDGREGHEVLIEAIARLRRQGRGVNSLLVGDGVRRTELQQLARQLGVARDVVFTGNVPFDQVAAYYAQIDLFVIPRTDERAARMVSPMKPFEAMAMRIPLLVSDLPALVEIAGDDERAHRFRAGDADSLARVAATLIDAPDVLHRLAESAAYWVRRERSWSVVAARFSDAYHELLVRSGAR
jgi:glycosyltransferase involved in cell wall biosynthesis